MKSIGQILGSESYKRQLSDPRWHTFAGSIRAKRNYCEVCRRTDVALQVHHTFYDFDRQLWDYGENEVMVLCVGCHRELHDELTQFRKWVFKYLNPQSFRVLNGALAVGLTQYDPLVFVHALAEFVSNPNLVKNHAAAWGMSSENKVKFTPKLDRKWVEENFPRPEKA